MPISKAKAKTLSKEELNKVLGDAWLNAYIPSNKFWNPLLNFPPECQDNNHLYLTWLLMQPEYFSFICKTILNLDIHPIQGLTLKTLWNHKFPMLIASRGFSKSWNMAVYGLIRMLLLPGRQLIITGAAFRQSKIVFEYMERIWYNAPILRDMCGGGSKNMGPAHGTDRWTFRIWDSVTSAIPLGDGERIRGQRANDVFADEFKSINREIFETVIAGFTVVSSSPIEAVKAKATAKLAEYLGIELVGADDDLKRDNQIVISGTCDYDFNHFAEYWRRWHSFVMSEGKQDELEKLFGVGKVPKEFNYKDYCIMRIPYDLVPEGFMDMSQITRSRVTMLPEIFNLEFGAVFVKDSNGFFKRSLIEGCVASPQNSIQIHGSTVVYGPMIKGRGTAKYVYAVDPASEVDNFSIVILELHPEHRRIVYCWTINKKEHRQRVTDRLVDENDFYAYCARKIRDLMKIFPCEAIAMDSQGGGYHVLECLHDKDKIRSGERPIWPIIKDGEPQDTDGEFGEHIVELIQFADTKWTQEANHGLKKDLMDKTLLFPHVDAIDYVLAENEDKQAIRIYDTLEDCIFDINELKDELSTIVLTKTPNGTDRWDTPEVKLPGQKKGRMRKDRYSALVMGNMLARNIQRTIARPEHSIQIGWAKDNVKPQDLTGPSFIGPQWAIDKLAGLY